MKQALPVLRIYRYLPYVGAFGNGTKFKFVANHLVAIYNVAYAESVLARARWAWTRTRSST